MHNIDALYRQARQLYLDGRCDAALPQHFPQGNT